MQTGNVMGANLKFKRNLRNVRELRDYLAALQGYLIAKDDHQTAVRVFPHDKALVQLASKTNLNVYNQIGIGAQDIHHTEDGSFTRAPMSAEDLIELGVRHVLIGHSETRTYYGVTDADVGKKLEAAIKAQIFATVCVGENVEQKETGKTEEVLQKQVEEGIVSALSEDTDQPQFDVAYEPVYAIAGFAKLLGRDPVPPEMSDIQHAHEKIKEFLTKQGFPSIANNIRISYGGSAKPKNAKELLQQAFINGLLIGTASWDVQDFIQMIDIAKKISVG